MSLTQYPLALPLEAVKSVIEIVKNRAIVERKQEFAASVWNIQGYAQYQLIGPYAPVQAHETQDGYPDPSVDGLLAGCVESLDEARAVCNSASFEVESPESSTDGDQSKTFDPTVLIMLLPYVIDLLKKLGWIKKS
jgi:hypothetical protein